MFHNHYFLFPYILLFFTCSSTAETSNGFTIDLIHRDSSLSPLHNPSSHSKYDKLSNALQRSTSRSHRFKNSNTSQPAEIQSSVLASGGEYLMNLSIGTPPVPILGIADTGSDLIWTQCKPCIHCYTQKSPLFDPKRSSSYNKVSCQSDACRSVGTSSCSTGTCSYRYAYGDRSHTDGDLATETVSFVSPSGSSRASFSDVVIGCGHNNGGTFGERGSGLIGLGGGPLSLVSQLTKALGGRFAYCLVPISNMEVASKMSFGANVVVSNNPRVVSTPLVKKDPRSTFYYLTLESISVGDTVLEYTTSLCESSRGYGFEKGNIVIDSGTTLTLLPQEFYSGLEVELERVIEGERVESQQGMLSLCYRSEGDMKVPIIKVKFEGGELELKASNAFVRVEEDVVCLAMRPANDVAIFGNLAQMDFLVSYDLEEGKVSFEPMDCSKHG